MITKIIAALKDDQGLGVAEYALILFLVSIASATIMTTLGGTISTKLSAFNIDLS